MKENRYCVIWLVLMTLLMAACSSAAPIVMTQPTPAAMEKTAEPVAQAIATLPAAATTEAALAEVKPEPAGPFPIGRFVSENNKSIAVQYNEDGTFEFYDFSPLSDDACRLRRESFGDTYVFTQ